jgi:hypothetical protein
MSGSKFPIITERSDGWFVLELAPDATVPAHRINPAKKQLVDEFRQRIEQA